VGYSDLLMTDVSEARTALMMEIVHTYEMSVYFKETTRRYFRFD